MPNPIPHVVTETGDQSSAPDGAVPISLWGAGSGGGGDVASVNGKTGTVVLSASDVGAKPSSYEPDLSGLVEDDDPRLSDARAPLAHTQAISTVTGLQAALDSKANSTALDGLVPATRTVAGKALSGNVTLAKADVGLGSVDNTTDAAKPVSSATQAALNLKANAASPAFTGTPTGITKAHVGLGNVDNTADSAKPVSTAQATAINAKVGSPNASVSGIEYYATVGDLPAVGVDGVLYFVDAG